MKLTLHGLQQYYVKLEENSKNRKLNKLLDTWIQPVKHFTTGPEWITLIRQPVIFVKSVACAIELDKLLVSCNFPSISIHSLLPQEEW